MKTTLDYYNKTARQFTIETQTANLEEIQSQFLDLLPQQPVLLDFGCGSGRDTKYFLSHGCAVEAIDGSEEFCKIAAEYAGIPVKQMFFQDLDESGKYDGIWACASILHLPKPELAAVFVKMQEALKEDGVIYTSFKYGSFEGERGERYFTDFTEETFMAFMANIPELKIERQWISGDVRPNRGEEQWLNVILRKGHIDLL